ncbi:sensor histidine kinase [Clostridium chrysemydis]|uniref:sensor histidine kinase n=1 Tax=Clostridium chrysemydis TaxID=2665504 RepID=UPI003F3BE160
MGIKLKNSLKKYISTLWIIELIILLVLSIINIDAGFKYLTSPNKNDGVSNIDAIFNRPKYYKSMLEHDSEEISQDLYKKTDGLRLLLVPSEDQKETIRNMIYNDSFYSNSGDKEKIPKDVYFIVRNKQTNDIFSNDPFFQGVKKLDVKDLRSVLSKKYEGREVIYDACNNENIYNAGIEEGLMTYSKKIVGQFEEIYYTSAEAYSAYVAHAVKRVIFFFISITINLLLLIKVVYLFVKGKGNVIISGNFVRDILYVFKNAFKYKGPRRTLITSVIIAIIFYIIYLYALAVDGTENNLIVKFFRSYPFKGSFLLVLLPMIGVLYSVKRNIEIGIIGDRIKVINDGNLHEDIKEVGGGEIKSLIQNINKMKDGYNIAVQEALKNEKLKTELITNVSHDLKTPLTSIINYVNILQRDNISEEERKEYLKIVEIKSNKLKVLIEDLFEVSKMNSGKIELQKENIDVVSLVYQVIGEYSSMYEDKNIDFIVESKEDEIIMPLDGVMFSRVIENITVNALKYSLEGTRVYADIEKIENEVIISFKNVANYEMSFDENSIFERFVRADESRNSKVEGSGLGLAITKSIVELHGGETKIKREGDLFKIFVILPLDTEDSKKDMIK